MDEKFADWLDQKAIFGAFENDQLVGVAGFSQLGTPKTKHRGSLFTMYVQPASRGSNIADDLVDAVISYARTNVIQLHCNVITENIAALKLYERKGFRTYGNEPRSLKVGDRYYDEYLMVLQLD